MRKSSNSGNQARLGEDEIDAHRQPRKSKGGPVDCLGMTFESDEARRAYFLERLQEKLADPDFRKIEGFPIGKDEDILALSDPPYFTACPNPFLQDFIKLYGKPYDPSIPYSRKPFAIDVSEGKTSPIYKAHSYHTKVPHLAIVPSILHYTEPGDLVLDGFCGTGMTGVAAQWCGTAPEAFRRDLETVWSKQDLGKPKWGVRFAILNDLSPFATFIAANYNLPFDVDAFEEAGQRLLDEVESELGWMYETKHTDGRTKGRIEYTVWSEVFTCPECSREIVFLDEALDEETKRVKESFPCPHCGSELTKAKLNRIYETRFDPVLGHTIRIPKRRPSLIRYSIDSKKYEKTPDAEDLDLLKRIEKLPWPPEVPTSLIPYMHMTHERARLDNAGVTHVHHFFLPRAAHSIAVLWRKAMAHPDARVRNMLRFFVEQAVWGISILNRYSPLHFSQVNRYLSGVYYVASQHAECSPWYILGGKLGRLVKAFSTNVAIPNSAIVDTENAAHLSLPDNFVDYIFTDPPFGENIYYSDLNFFTESWYPLLTDARQEAIIDRAKGKALPEYQSLMQSCFEEYYRVLKPGRWMTVVFHNSRNSVWNAIQEAMLAAGFVVADVRTMDKQQGSYRQVTSTAVKQDLVISAYKPNGGLEERFKVESRTEESVWDFIRTHLSQLPVFVQKDSKAEVIAERQNYLLFDRMIAFHLRRGVTVPLSATEFYSGLAQRFPERDGMYFLPEQAAEHDKKRMTVKEILQLQLFITDESSAIQWLKQQLAKKPQTSQELNPNFMKELPSWNKHEKLLELRELLEQNFIMYDGEGEVPGPIHSYLSTTFKELRNLSKTDPALMAKAKDRWYIPDPRRASDLEKLRDKALLREFHIIIESKKRLKEFRIEAVRAGFKKCYDEGDYKTIMEVAKKLPSNIVEEDSWLLMYSDLARSRQG